MTTHDKIDRIIDILLMIVKEEITYINIEPERFEVLLKAEDELTELRLS